MCTLPAGLHDNNVEFYRHEGETYALYKGKTLHYKDLPLEIRSIFNWEMIKDEAAFKAMTEMGHISFTQSEEMFVGCRYGNFDNSPDLNLDTGVLTPDAPSCDKEMSCPGFGKVCIIPCGLCKQEYFTARWVATGLQDEEIAEVMHISVSTVRSHLSKVREKLNLSNRAEITNWAIKRNII